MIAANRANGTVQLRRYHLGRLAAEHVGISPYVLTVDELAEWLAMQSWGAEGVLGDVLQVGDDHGSDNDEPGRTAADRDCPSRPSPTGP